MELKRREVVSGLVGFSMAGPALAQKAPQAPTETVTVTEKQEKEKEAHCSNFGETPED